MPNWEGGTEGLLSKSFVASLAVTEYPMIDFLRGGWDAANCKNHEKLCFYCIFGLYEVTFVLKIFFPGHFDFYTLGCSYYFHERVGIA